MAQNRKSYWRHDFDIPSAFRHTASTAGRPATRWREASNPLFGPARTRRIRRVAKATVPCAYPPGPADALRAAELSRVRSVERW